MVDLTDFLTHHRFIFTLISSSGSGTTGVVALDLGRRFVGYEIIGDSGYPYVRMYSNQAAQPPCAQATTVAKLILIRVWVIQVNIFNRGDFYETLSQ